MVACGVKEIQHVKSNKEFAKIKKSHERKSKKERARARCACLSFKSKTKKDSINGKKQPENASNVSKKTTFYPNKSGIICALLVIAGAGEIMHERERVPCLHQPLLVL